MKLQGQPLRILRALINQPGHLITREQFQHELWTDTTVDFEHGLNAAMNRLRQVLGDSAERPRFIETLPGLGYRFIAPIQDTGASPVLMMAPPLEQEQTAALEPAEPQPPARQGKNVWPRSVVFLAVIIGLAGGYWVANRPLPNAAVQQVRLSISPPEGFALEMGSSRQTFALSPDGTKLAYTAMNASGRFQTFIRELSGIESRPMPDSMGSYHVFWAADSLSLFQSVRGSLRRTILTGDSFQVLCDVPALMLTGMLLTPNVLLSARTSNYLIPISGGTPQPVRDFYPWPDMLPDGKHLLYTAFDAQSGHHRARVVKFGEPGTAKDLVETDSRAMYAPSVRDPQRGYLVYVRAGNILAQSFDPRTLRTDGQPLPIVPRTYSFLPTGAADISVSRNGLLAYSRYLSRSGLAWVNRRGEIESTIGPSNVNLKQARISPDGKKIATVIFDVTRGVNDIWVINAGTGAAHRLASGRGSADGPVWSPNSSRLLFNRAYEAPPKLFIRNLDGADSDENLPEDYFQMANDWSPDGRFLAYTNTSFAALDREMKGDVWLIDLARNRRVIHLIKTPFDELNPAFSPDGHWLAYTSDESGRSELYVQAFEAGDSPHLSGERHLVSRQGVAALRWRRDGKELYYLAWDGRVHAVKMNLSPKLKIGTPLPLFTISTDARTALHGLQGFDVSPDGQHFLIPVVSSPEKSEIIVIQNWEAGLQERFARVK
ncbi:MAG: winged helix-turn-helix domain-containing protein [Candidatus Solibacter sp.]